METSDVVWIVVAVLVVLALAALVSVAMRKRKEKELDRQRTEAQQLRTEATTSAREATEARVDAQEAEARAERLRLEAERAQDSAAQARQGYDVEQARIEDRVREADRLDPDVDHRSRTYEGDLTPPVPGTGPATTTTAGSQTGSPEPPRESGPAPGTRA